MTWSRWERCVDLFGVLSRWNLMSLLYYKGGTVVQWLRSIDNDWMDGFEKHQHDTHFLAWPSVTRTQIKTVKQKIPKYRNQHSEKTSTFCHLRIVEITEITCQRFWKDLGMQWAWIDLHSTLKACNTNITRGHLLKKGEGPTRTNSFLWFAH